MNNLTDSFLNRLLLVRESNIPARVIAQAELCLVDYIGAALAGARMMKCTGKRYLRLLQKNTGPATVIGSGCKADIYTAILVNGTNAHATELDDGHRLGMLHPGVPVITPLLALAEAEKIKARDFFIGVIVGYEAAVELARLVQPSHREKGYHATGTCGTIGAAMGISAALNLSREQTKAALSAAVMSASGILEMQEDDSTLKPYSAGRAALSGFISAFIGRSGALGPQDILGGKRGFLATMASLDIPQYKGKPSNTFAIEEIYRKLYASCRHSHSAIEAALLIREKHKNIKHEVDTINVYTYRSAIAGHDHKTIQGISSAKMSIPFSVAVALTVGRAGVMEFSPPFIEDKEILALASKVNVLADDELTALSPQTRAAVVEIKARDGKIYRQRVDFPKGEPENPLTPKEIKSKFIDLTVYSGKTTQEASKILEIIWNLDDNISELMVLL